MKNIATKTSGISKFFSDDCNSMAGEEMNAVTTMGQPLNAADNYQLIKSIIQAAGVGDFYSDTGSATAYVLSPQSGRVAPFAYMDGLVVRFRPQNSNSGAATITVGGLGIVPVNQSDGVSAISNGSIVGGRICSLTYNDAHSCFTLEDTAFGDRTGDWKFTSDPATRAGYIGYSATSTIGDALSGATFASSACYDLYVLWWTNFGITHCPMHDGNPYGASALADWTAHRAMTAYPYYNTVLAAQTLTHTFGTQGGSDDVTLTIPKMPNHAHGVSDPGHGHNVVTGLYPNLQHQKYEGGNDNSRGYTDGAVTGIAIVATGGGEAHENRQPTSYVNVLVKL